MRASSLALLAALAVAAPAAGVGCSHRATGATAPPNDAARATNGATTATAPSSPSASGDAAAPMGAQDLGTAMRDAFARDPILRGQAMRATVRDGAVVLEGTATDLRAKDRAVALASAFKGVRALDDRVTVTPPPRSDEDVLADLRDALARDPATRSAALQLNVQNGRVTITGTTDSGAQRKIVDAIAAGTLGVRAVIDRAGVLPAAQRSDAEIAAEVRDRLHDDLWLDGTNVTADARGRVVVLRGEVGSLAQKNRAFDDAWVDGVANVDAGALAVQSPVAHAAPAATRSDPETRAAVERALRRDPRLRAGLPAVDVRDGVVTLRGDVPDARAARSAEEDARAVVGVWRVDDRLTVPPKLARTDADLEEAEKRAIYNDLGAPDSRGVSIAARNGKVYLDGKVATPHERDVIEADARSVPGVAAVEDDLQVVGYGHGTMQRSPDQVRAGVVSALFWDPRIDMGKMHVTVAPDGTATITGTVDRWGEIRAATDDAERGGATHVVNLLQLAGNPSVHAPR